MYSNTYEFECQAQALSVNSIALQAKELKKYFSIKSGIFSRFAGNVHIVDYIN